MVSKGNQKVRALRHTLSVVKHRTNLNGLVARALLALFLFVSQVHFCEAGYVRPDGQNCLECIEISDRSYATAGLAQLHGDCHDCCEIRGCEAPQVPVAPAVAHSLQFEFATIPEPLVMPPLGSPVRTVTECCYLTSAPSTGPPQTDFSRGPPPCLQHISSAGERTTRLA